MIPPIRVIDGKGYYVMPVHPGWFKLIEEAGGAAHFSKLVGVTLVEMTDEEMEIINVQRHTDNQG
jgi:phosphoribosylaminoimidazole-succinocarboxamide synthase